MAELEDSIINMFGNRNGSVTFSYVTKNAFGSWRDEWNNCFEDKMPCASLCFHDHQYTGTPISNKRKELAWNYKRCDLILVNYESLIPYEDELRGISSDGTMMAFDEIHEVQKVDGSVGGPGTEFAGENSKSIVDACGSTRKTIRCLELATDLLNEGKSLIIWCFFRRSMNNLAEALGKFGYTGAVINGSTPQANREKLLDRFKRGDISFIVINLHTLAESVPLYSICQDIIYFGYGYNLVHLLQSKDRIHRLGLPDGQCAQYYFMETFFSSKNDGWSLDKKIYDRLSEKEEVMLRAIDQGTLGPESTDREEVEAEFGGLFDLEGDGVSPSRSNVTER